MLNIINDLRPFFDDCYRRVGVREYAKLIKVSPPTASKMLASYTSESLLLRSTYRNHILFHANKESSMFVDLSRIYWRLKLSSLMELVDKKLTSPTIVLFGSLAKAEAKPDSDVDLAIFAAKKELNIEMLGKRRIQMFWFDSFKDVKNRELANNILNGYVLRGKLKL